MPEFVNPKQVLEKVGLVPDMTGADFGSGSGGWAIPMATILKDGIVLAVDVQEAPLSALDGKAKLYGISNIKKVQANVEIGIEAIEDCFCDFVLISDLLFQVDEREKVFVEARRVLKPEGKVLVVEWKMDSPLGPIKGKIPKAEIEQLAKKTNFKFKKEFSAGDYHFALLFSK